MKLDKNYKVRVTPEQSRQIQELLFDCGFQWAMTGQTIHSDREIILIELDKLRLLNGAKSTLKFYIEIAADDLIALLTDLSKSAENPLQGVELTPEFEAVPKFKVGDRVYLGLSAKIEVIKNFTTINSREYIDVKSGKLCDSEICCHATQENYERLQATFPDIEFEQPPKPLTGSDLARAMLDKGWKYVPCYISDSSDTHALERQTRNAAVIIGTHKDHPSFFIYGSGKSFIYHAVPFDPRTGEPLTQAVLDE